MNKFRYIAGEVLKRIKIKRSVLLEARVYAAMISMPNSDSEPNDFIRKVYSSRSHEQV